MSKNIKNIIIFVIILAIIATAYFMFFGKTSAPANTPTNSALQTTATGTAPTNSVVNPNAMTSAEATKISQEFVNQLLNLQAIKLNDDIFSSLAFQSLQDFSIVLVQPGNEGRPNPFAPFGADGIDPNGSSTLNDAVFTPGEAWTIVKIGNANVSYPPSWTSVPISTVGPNSAQAVVVGYTFNIPGGFTITWGGPQSSCTSGQFGSFQYGVSTKVCVKNLTVQLNGENLTDEAKANFGELIQRNM
jgi:hypothetical protein